MLHDDTFLKHSHQGSIFHRCKAVILSYDHNPVQIHIQDNLQADYIWHILVVYYE
jgi:hypothetical protein